MRRAWFVEEAAALALLVAWPVAQIAAAPLLAAPVPAAPVIVAVAADPVPPAQVAHASGTDVVRPGKWNRTRPPAGWVVVETRNYQVQCECGKEKAAALGAHLEAMLELYQRFLPMRRPMDTFVLKLFRDRAGFLAYAGDDERSERIGYYDTEQRELVAYDTGIVLGHRDIPTQIGLAVGAADRLTLTERQTLDPIFDAITDAYIADTARVVAHEGWHQYFQAWTVSVVPMPAWLDEGIADWFSTATRDPDRDATHGYRLGDIDQIRLRALRRAMSRGMTVAFRTMLGYDQAQYYVDAEASYAQGWSMVHFLMQHVVRADRELIPRLLLDFRDTKNFQQSTATVFQGVDLDALDREWSAWVLRQPVVDPMAALARAASGRLRASDFVADPKWIETFNWYVGHPDALSGPEPGVPGVPAAAPPSAAPAAPAAPSEEPAPVTAPAPAPRDPPAPSDPAAPADSGAPEPTPPASGAPRG